MIAAVLSEFGATLLFLSELVQSLRSQIQRKSRSQFIRLTVNQIAMICTRTLGTVLLAGAFVGAILVLQFQAMLAPYQASIFLGGLNTSSLVREIGPLIISFLLAGKIGAYTTAELGTMRVTEQIDAMKTLGRDPVALVIVPRFLAIVISSLILLVMGLAIGVFASMLVAETLYHINWMEFASQIPKFVTLGTFVSGFVKSLVYSLIVGIIACRQGYFAHGGAQGVGQAVTRAAIHTNFSIVIANFAIAQLLRALETLGQ